MQKKCIFAIVLALLFVLNTAFAEDAEFSIRGGIKWGMSRDEVLAIEAGNYFDKNTNAEKDADGEKRAQFIEDVLKKGHAAFGNGAQFINPDSGEGLTLLTVDGAKVSRYEAAPLIFAFCEDKLVACLYGFRKCDPDYLLKALEMKYGEFTDAGYDEFEEAVQYIFGNEHLEMIGKAEKSEHKLLENGTYIHSVLIDGDYGILYQDMKASWDELAYDQFGL